MYPCAIIKAAKLRVCRLWWVLRNHEGVFFEVFSYPFGICNADEAEVGAIRASRISSFSPRSTCKKNFNASKVWHQALCTWFRRGAMMKLLNFNFTKNKDFRAKAYIVGTH